MFAWSEHGLSQAQGSVPGPSGVGTWLPRTNSFLVPKYVRGKLSLKKKTTRDRKLRWFQLRLRPKTALLQHPTLNHDDLDEQITFFLTSVGNGIIVTLGLPDGEERVDSRVKPIAMG